MKTNKNPKGAGRKPSGKTLLRFWTYPKYKGQIDNFIKTLEDGHTEIKA